VNIVAAETGGFRGNSYYGYDLVLQALIRDFMRRDVPTVANRVNLWGVPPYLDPFWRGNIEGVRGLLQLLGLEVNSFFTQDDSLAGIEEASSAVLNIAVSDIFGAEAAHVFEEVHGTPFLLSPLPIGPTASGTFLRTVGQVLGRSDAELDAVIARENRRYYQFFEPLIECFNDLDFQRYAAVVGDANYGVALTRFLADDLGWLPEFVTITDQLSDDQQTTLRSRFDGFTSGLRPHLVYETDASEIIRHFNAYWGASHGERYFHAFSPAFVVGSSLDRDFAALLGAGHLSVSFPVTNRAVIDRGYTGYRGGLRLVEDLISAIVVNR
ncbi:MAG TPA: nitrogenase component 1, partial [Anaerolineae bacterium]